MKQSIGSENPLRDYLADHDAPCPACGYNVRGLKGGTCPECGLALALQVSLADAKLGPYLAALVGLTSGAGTSTFFLILFLISWVQNGPDGIAEPLAWLAVLLAGAVGEGVPLVLLARRRGRVWFLRKGVQGRRIAVAAWLATALWVVTVFLMIGLA